MISDAGEIEIVHKHGLAQTYTEAQELNGSALHNLLLYLLGDTLVM